MKQLAEVELTQGQLQALEELRGILLDRFEVEELVLFGSYVQDRADEESDLDLLILTSHPFTRTRRHEITDVVFEVNLKYDTNISTLVVDRQAWESGPYSVMPIHDEILETGARL